MLERRKVHFSTSPCFSLSHLPNDRQESVTGIISHAGLLPVVFKSPVLS